MRGAPPGGVSLADAGDLLGNSVATNPDLGGMRMASQFETASRAVLAVQRPKKNRPKKENRG